MILRRERVFLSPANSLLIQRKVVDLLSKKENDVKLLTNSLKFYKVLSLQNVGNTD
jgi:hypothetical protein